MDGSGSKSVPNIMMDPDPGGPPKTSQVSRQISDYPPSGVTIMMALIFKPLDQAC
jgi:hypothetical protein